MDWTLEDNMVDSLFSCVTLTGSRGGHSPFVQTGSKTSDTSAAVVELDPHCSWEGHSRKLGASTDSRSVQPLCLSLVIHPVLCTYVVAVR